MDGGVGAGGDGPPPQQRQRQPQQEHYAGGGTNRRQPRGGGGDVVASKSSSRASSSSSSPHASAPPWPPPAAPLSSSMPRPTPNAGATAKPSHPSSSGVGKSKGRHMPVTYSVGWSSLAPSMTITLLVPIDGRAAGINGDSPTPFSRAPSPSPTPAPPPVPPPADAGGGEGGGGRRGDGTSSSSPPGGGGGATADGVGGTGGGGGSGAAPPAATAAVADPEAGDAIVPPPPPPPSSSSSAPPQSSSSSSPSPRIAKYTLRMNLSGLLNLPTSNPAAPSAASTATATPSSPSPSSSGGSPPVFPPPPAGGPSPSSTATATSGWLDVPTLRSRLTTGGAAIGLKGPHLFRAIRAVEESVGRIGGWVPRGTASVRGVVTVADDGVAFVADVWEQHGGGGGGAVKGIARGAGGAVNKGGGGGLGPGPGGGPTPSPPPATTTTAALPGRDGKGKGRTEAGSTTALPPTTPARPPPPPTTPRSAPPALPPHPRQARPLPLLPPPPAMTTTTRGSNGGGGRTRPGGGGAPTSLVPLQRGGGRAPPSAPHQQRLAPSGGAPPGSRPHYPMTPNEKLAAQWEAERNLAMMAGIGGGGGGGSRTGPDGGMGIGRGRMGGTMGGGGEGGGRVASGSERGRSGRGRGRNATVMMAQLQQQQGGPMPPPPSSQQRKPFHHPPAAVPPPPPPPPPLQRRASADAASGPPPHLRRRASDGLAEFVPPAAAIPAPPAAVPAFKGELAATAPPFEPRSSSVVPSPPTAADADGKVVVATAARAEDAAATTVERIVDAAAASSSSSSKEEEQPRGSPAATATTPKKTATAASDASPVPAGHIEAATSTPGEPRAAPTASSPWTRSENSGVVVGGGGGGDAPIAAATTTTASASLLLRRGKPKPEDAVGPLLDAGFSPRKVRAAVEALRAASPSPPPPPPAPSSPTGGGGAVVVAATAPSLPSSSEPPLRQSRSWDAPLRGGGGDAMVSSAAADPGKRRKPLYESAAGGPSSTTDEECGGGDGDGNNGAEGRISGEDIVDFLFSNGMGGGSGFGDGGGGETIAADAPTPGPADDGEGRLDSLSVMMRRVRREQEGPEREGGDDGEDRMDSLSEMMRRVRREQEEEREREELERLRRREEEEDQERRPIPVTPPPSRMEREGSNMMNTMSTLTDDDVDDDITDEEEEEDSVDDEDDADADDVSSVPPSSPQSASTSSSLEALWKRRTVPPSTPSPPFRAPFEPVSPPEDDNSDEDEARGVWGAPLPTAAPGVAGGGGAATAVPASSPWDLPTSRPRVGGGSGAGLVGDSGAVGAGGVGASLYANFPPTGAAAASSPAASLTPLGGGAAAAAKPAPVAVAAATATTTTVGGGAGGGRSGGGVWGNTNKLRLVKSASTGNPPPAPAGGPGAAGVSSPPPSSQGGNAGKEGTYTRTVRVLDLPPDLNGFVFHCNAHTKEECLERNLFGCPSGGQYGPHSNAKAGDLLFLADFSSWSVTGIFVATSDAGLNLERSAWNGRFPWQIRIKPRSSSSSSGSASSHPKLKTVHVDKVNEILGLGSGSKLNMLTQDQLVKLMQSKEFGPCVPAHLYKTKQVPVGGASASTAASPVVATPKVSYRGAASTAAPAPLSSGAARSFDVPDGGGGPPTAAAGAGGVAAAAAPSPLPRNSGHTSAVGPSGRDSNYAAPHHEEHPATAMHRLKLVTAWFDGMANEIQLLNRQYNERRLVGGQGSNLGSRKLDSVRWPLMQYNQIRKGVGDVFNQWLFHAHAVSNQETREATRNNRMTSGSAGQSSSINPLSVPVTFDETESWTRQGKSGSSSGRSKREDPVLLAHIPLGIERVKELLRSDRGTSALRIPTDGMATKLAASFLSELERVAVEVRKTQLNLVRIGGSDFMKSVQDSALGMRLSEETTMTTYYDNDAGGGGSLSSEQDMVTIQWVTKASVVNGHTPPFQKIYKTYFDMLCQNYRESSASTDPDGKHMLTRIFVLLCRYDIIGSLKSCFQAALPPLAFDSMVNYFGVSHECFASPLDNRSGTSYNSIFPDIDRHFGSLGSFFDFMPSEGSFMSNPPFDDGETMKMMFDHILGLLRRSDDDTSPLSFLVVIPKTTESINNIKDTPYLRRMDTIEAEASYRSHFFLSGSQHKKSGYKSNVAIATGSNVGDAWSASVPTLLIWLQNDFGHDLWTPTDEKVRLVMNGFWTNLTATRDYHEG